MVEKGFEQVYEGKYDSGGNRYDYLVIDVDILRETSTGKYVYREHGDDTGSFWQKDETYESLLEAFNNLFDIDKIGFYLYAFEIKFLEPSQRFQYTKHLMEHINHNHAARKQIAEIDDKTLKSISRYLGIELKFIENAKEKGLKEIWYTVGGEQLFAVGNVELNSNMVTIKDENEDVLLLTQLSDKISIKTQAIGQNPYCYFVKN